jgi:uncharacterized protein
MEPVAADKEERMWAMFTHLGAFAGHFFPFGNVIVPLVIWILKKDQYPLVNDQGKESINCQISYSIYIIVAALLCFVVVGFVILPVVYLADVIFVIIAAIKANEGVRYRYPAIFRFVS